MYLTAGNRWHIDCFRCNTCGTLLDSDANLLLLGDGSLICNNCTYSCNACGNKIEDLAILTGDQAFCASCFRCRNCKRKIENLRYARTSQGIFCMSCHESLMARRRKKAKTTTKASPGGGTPSVEKALPSLPPGAAPESAFTPEHEGPPGDTLGAGPAVKSPPERQLKSKKNASSNNLKRDVSPMSDEARRGGFTPALSWLKQYDRMTDTFTDGPTFLPASTYKDARSTNASPNAEDDDEQGYLPMAYDPNPAPGPPPGLPARKRVPVPASQSPPVKHEGRPPRDYFSGRLSSKPASRDPSRDENRPSSARSGSTERDPTQGANHPKASPHIAYQEKGRSRKRETSGYNTPASQAQSPNVASNAEKPERPKPQHLDTGSFTLQKNENFKLQEVPKARKASSRSSSRVGTASSVSPSDSKKEENNEAQISRSPVSLDSGHSGVNPFDDPKRKEGFNSSAAPLPPARHADRPVRGDSLTASAQKQPASPQRTAPQPPTPTNNAMQSSAGHGRNQSTSSILSFADEQSSTTRDNGGLKGVESPPLVRSSFDAPPPRNSSRTTQPSKSVANGDFIAPRAPPLPPPVPSDRHNHKHTGSYDNAHSSGLGGEGQMSPVLRSAGLPKHSADGGFSMEEEMTRILRGDNKKNARESQEGTGGSVMRRVSNAVKHGRSFSDRGLHSSSGKSGHGASGSVDVSSPLTISSPMMSSPPGGDGVEQLRAQLRRAQAKIGELEAEKSGLEDKVNSSNSIKQANSELREKRSTMAFLDTQRDMVVRELEVMTEHLTKAKDNSQPLDLSSLQNSVLKDFAESLRKLKEQMGTQIEDLMQKRNELTDEITSLIQMKDKGFSEYEALSSKNAQLLEMNNGLVHSIQDVYKANRGANSIDAKRDAINNGLGIYHPGAKPDTPSADVRNLNLVSTDSSMPDLLRENEAEPATVLTTPQVVNIRKGAQAKKFNWRKGGEKVAKNVTKGLKGAFASAPAQEGVQYREREIGLPYNMTQQSIGGSEQGSMMSGSTRVGADNRPNAAGFGFFGQKNGGIKGNNLSSLKYNNSSSSNLATAVEASGKSLLHSFSMTNLLLHDQSKPIPTTPPTVLFGSELSARCEHENRVIPSIVTRCIAEVETRGMLIEGVYRKSGGAGQVKQVQQGFEKDDKYDISDDDLDIHAITSALKQYFRKLPTPLITYDVYEPLLEAGQLGADKEKQIQAIRAAIAELPEHHRNCLEYLVQHLARVVSHEGRNLMTPGNLAVVFAPTIMRPESIEKEMSDMLAQRTAVQALLDSHQAVFAVGDD